MHFCLVCLVFWTLSLQTHSLSTVSTHTQYMTEQRTRGITENIPSSPPPVSSLLPSSSCRYDVENGLAIFCTDVDIEDVAPNIPNDTVHLEITNSPLPVFTKPLLSHLNNLRYLKLNHNAHRYITSKAFQGLHNLEELDLSFNDIIVLSKAFTFTPNLKVLNLSSNQVIKISTIATALSHLKNFGNLSLNHNVRIRGILGDEFLPLSNTSLMHLELFNTTIKIIEEGAFRPLRQLKVLELSVNYLDEKGFRNVTVDLREIEVLFIRYVQFQKSLPYDALSVLTNTSIQHLDISYNYFPQIDKFPPLKMLHTLEIAFCSVEILTGNVFAGMPNLQRLHLGGNLLLGLSKYVFTLPSLKNLILANQFPDGSLRQMPLTEHIFENVTNLLQLDLRSTRTDGVVRRFSFHGLRKLKTLLLSSCVITVIEDYAFESMVNLEGLQLKNNNIDHLTNHTFAGLRSLKMVILSQNNINFVQGVYPFQNSRSLSSIFLNNNGIVEIPKGMFFKNLHLREVTLDENKVVAWNFTILPPESNVSTLLLSKNKIAYITPSMMADFFRVTDVLDVSENPFNCTACGMKDFQIFMNETDVSLFVPGAANGTGTYTCSTPKNLQGMSVQSVDIPVWHCFPQEINMAVFVITLLVSVIIPTLLISIFCYVSRWYIRYWLFHIKATAKERTQRKDEHQKYYIYDAFVSYNASDTPWVISTLIPALEEQEPRFKLCIHERDFEVGRLITDNILDAIEVSRKVILLLSESFLTSEWCLFELHMAQHKLFDETRDVLVLVKLKDINKKFYTKNLKYLEKTRPCLSWTESPVGQKLFWDKMRKILGEPSTGSEEQKPQC